MFLDNLFISIGRIGINHKTITHLKTQMIKLKNMIRQSFKCCEQTNYRYATSEDGHDSCA